jgi:YD repeat-containing protein
LEVIRGRALAHAPPAPPQHRRAANNLGNYTLADNEDNKLTTETTPWKVSLTYSYDTNGQASRRL